MGKGYEEKRTGPLEGLQLQKGREIMSQEKAGHLKGNIETEGRTELDCSRVWISSEFLILISCFISVVFNEKFKLYIEN